MDACPRCGAPKQPGALGCINCGLGFGPPGSPGTQGQPQQYALVQPVADPALKFILPVGRSGLAIAAGYAGLFAILVIPAPLAVLLSVLAILDIRKRPEKLGMGRAIFGLVTGIPFTVILLFALFAR